MNIFKYKRDSLELFVQEQILGPGAFNKRFFLLKKWDKNEFSGLLLKNCSAFTNTSEVIAEVPAYQYSSGILFPNANQLKDESKLEPSEKGTSTNDDDGLKPSENAKLDDEELYDNHNESMSSKNQNYPNTFGLALAVNASALVESELAVTVSYRAYTKIKQEEALSNELGYWVSTHEKEVENIFIKYYENIFLPKWIDDNLFVILSPSVDVNNILYTVDYVNTEKLMRDFVMPVVNKAFPGNQYFKATKRLYDGTEFNFTTFFEDKVIDEISKSMKSGQGESLCELIQCIEIFNIVKEIVLALKTIYRKSSMKNHPTPIWESNYFKHAIQLPAFKRENKIQRGEINFKEDNTIVLKYQYLLYKNHQTGDDNIYIKLVGVNNNTIDIKADEPPQLNKKDEANKKAFFGVSLQVDETKAKTIVPYNPPNLLEIDDEDNFNKLVYRQYKDYGEGYNTSVNWIAKDLISLWTEFLPEQETPKVDFRPLKVEGEKIVSRIDETILSFRYLSSLSSTKDSEIISGLEKFVDQYNNWIVEQQAILLREGFAGKKLDLLERQIRACVVDYERLKRNIKLLTDPKALAAFRTMNTAMFMQLHHGRKIKENKKQNLPPFTPEENTSEFYTKIILDREYQWRSFQLAFILLNIDAFIKPSKDDKTIQDIFGTGWPERNEIADLVWFPTGGGKTEAYLGIIAFAICFRRFTGSAKSGGTTVLMRYTLRLLTLQQFQRATLLICALETIRKNKFRLSNELNLGSERITIGLFVGAKSLPNTWDDMTKVLDKIAGQVKEKKKITTNLPYTECPWCGGDLFVEQALPNISPYKGTYAGMTNMHIVCPTDGCSFHNKRPSEEKSLPLRLFDEDILKSPPTLLFGTVDKFAALANKVSTANQDVKSDSRRIFGKGVGLDNYPPDLIIQDELHLLLGPLGSAVGLFEKAIDELCTYEEGGILRKAKVITSTATTRNTDKQIFALFDRRSEIFPKQGINCDDSFFSYYERNIIDGKATYISNRKYIGILPIGKTQVWMQLRIASIALAHRTKFIFENFTSNEIFRNESKYNDYREVFDYYHTVLSYFNSLKEVGKTQSQLSHYLPGDLNLIVKNTLPWNFLDKMIRDGSSIADSELTGRLSGEEVKTNLSRIEKTWALNNHENPPEFIIATNMISVGIDVSRFNTMIISSMPRNTAEYIQASSRVARDKEGIVFTVHHPFRSRDISHYQRFKEFHEKFYSYVEPISVTPFAHKALERYLAMFLAVVVRHNPELGLSNNRDASQLNADKVKDIIIMVREGITKVSENSAKLDHYLRTRTTGLNATLVGIIDQDELDDVIEKTNELVVERWLMRLTSGTGVNLNYRDDHSIQSLYEPRTKGALHANWNVKYSLREIAPSSVIKTVQQ